MAKDSQKAQNLASKTVITALLVVLSIIFVMPLVWTVSTSLKSTPQTMEDPVNADLGTRMSIMWIPQPQEEAKLKDPGRPLFQVKDSANTLYKPDGKALKAHLDSRQGDQLNLVVEEPTEYVGTKFTVPASGADEIERSGLVYQVKSTGEKVVAFDDPKTGEARTGILEPTDKKGQELKVAKESLVPVRHFGPLWDNFRKAYEFDKDKLGYTPFNYYARNSLLLVVLTVSGVLFSNALVGYAFARLKWWGRDALFAITLATMMVPFVVTLVPVFAMFKSFGWIGTFRPLWVPAWFGAAFNIFLLRQFFRTIPFELSEAAKLDGCSEWQIFYQVILPLAKPALAVVALFSFLGVWNDFLGPLIYLQDQKLFTLAVGLNSYRSQAGGTDINLQMAASTIIIAPIIITYFFTQRLFIQGIAATGLKG